MDSMLGGRTQAGTGECTYMSIVPKQKNKKNKNKTEKRGKGYEGWEKEEISSPLD
ncbi:hypothetical protein L208DRAFT_1398010 [Tricholoma matsutake]|nr:hypothetical protein L208DRAFT_1398010 [Tricholoma matsutake 945]